MQAACFIPSLPEAVETYQVKHRIIPGIDPALDGRINDIMSSGYGFFYNLSSMVGPVIGGALFSKYGFIRTLDINMCFSAAVATIFIVFNCGPKVFQKDAEHKKIMKRMKKIARVILKQEAFTAQEKLKRAKFLEDANRAASHNSYAMSSHPQSKSGTFK